MKFKQVIKTLRLPEGFKVRTAADYEHAMAQWKASAVIARQSGNEWLERVLSQCKEAIKKERKKYCPVCSGAKSRYASRCQNCQPRGTPLTTQRDPESESGGVSLTAERKLTKIQNRIIAAIASGQSSEQIAAARGCSASTINSHRSRILARIGFPNSSASLAGVMITRYAIRNNLIEA